MNQSAKCRRCGHRFVKANMQRDHTGHYRCQPCAERKIEHRNKACNGCRKTFPKEKVSEHESGKLYCGPCLAKIGVRQKFFYSVAPYHCPDCGYKVTLKPCVACAAKSEETVLT